MVSERLVQSQPIETATPITSRICALYSTHSAHSPHPSATFETGSQLSPSPQVEGLLIILSNQ